MMNIQKNHIMVIGDAMNDAGMIQYAGISVAMANAIEEIKQMADIITEGTNNEDGVAEVVEKYILKKG
jgi:hydroxymethylpyrimidine pyrophosphatase-like HAD family hydrolase